jgi:hypothetical protein
MAVDGNVMVATFNTRDDDEGGVVTKGGRSPTAKVDGGPVNSGSKELFNDAS